MDCQEIKPALLEYLMQETPAEERGGIERHLKSCGACTQELAELRQTMGLLVRGDLSEEMPRRIRLVAEPANRWRAFWQNPARMAFAGAGLLCLVIGLLALSRASASYQNGNFEIAFGAPAVSSVVPTMRATPSAGVAQPLDKTEVKEMISAAVAESEARQEKQTGLMAKNVSDQVQQRWQRDLQEMAGSMRYFQAAQNMMWKEQVQNEQLVSTLVRQSPPAAPAHQ